VAAHARARGAARVDRAAAPGHRLTEAQVTALIGGPYPRTEIWLDPI
jgi:hypothetical protein